jgi:catechol 2,3-dioxygenase
MGSSDHLVSEALYLSDPDGLGIEVYADRPRDQWRWLGRELAMATEPLDVRSLVEAGGGAPWTGAPAGTVVGHVHLHVGELGEAERFYHNRLGLTPTARGYPGALFMSAGGYHHHLGVNAWAAGSPPAGDDDARLLDWELMLPTTDDADAAAERLATSGYFVERAGPGWLAADPWGTRLRLSSGSLS